MMQQAAEMDAQKADGIENGAGIVTGGLMLMDFRPYSELVVEHHEIHRPRSKVLDVHTHLGWMAFDGYENRYDTGETVARLKDFGVERIVNLDGLWGEGLTRMQEKTKGYEDFILTFGTVPVQDIDVPGFEGRTRKILQESKARGIRGLKIWKSIGLYLKEASGRYVRLDDHRLQVIWETAAELDLPVLIHVADPIAFFKPIDRFNERYEELHAHPEWSFHGPDFYSFDQLMAMQERVIGGNPNTTFIVAHVGSCAENLAYVANSLDRFPNMVIDIAERIGELGRQPNTARRFLTRYSDRILFGTDGTPLKMEYPIYYRFLETDDDYFNYSYQEVPPQGRWMISGLQLEDEVLDRIYWKNAARVLGLE